MYWVQALLGSCSWASSLSTLVWGPVVKRAPALVSSGLNWWPPTRDRVGHPSSPPITLRAAWASRYTKMLHPHCAPACALECKFNRYCLLVAESLLTDYGITDRCNHHDNPICAAPGACLKHDVLY